MCRRFAFVFTALLGALLASTCQAAAAPVLANMEAGAVNYTENAPPLAITAALTVSDSDSPTLASATISIATNYTAAEDLLGFVPNVASMGNIDMASNVAGTLTLTSAGATATLLQWQAALRAVTYSNTSDTPNILSRTIKFTVNDGTSDSNAATRTVDVVATNDAPVLANMEAGAVNYTENAPPLAITAALTVSDSDSPTLASATISIATNYTAAEDSLAFANDGMSMGNIGGSYNAATGVLALSSAGATATLLQWQAALRAVTYSNTSDNPNILSRAIKFTVNDGTSDSNAVTRTVDVVATNDAPVLAGLEVAAANADENIPTAVTSTLAGADVDSPNLIGATIQITAGYESTQDSLVFVNTPAITGSFDSATGILALSGTDSVSHYNTALRSIRFLNSSDNPTAGSRTIVFQIDDGGAMDNLSNSLSRQVVVAAVNDAPVLSAIEIPSANYVEGAAPVALTATLSAGDVDGSTLTSAAISITNVIVGQDILGFSANPATMGNIGGSYNAATGVLALTSAGPTATLPQWQAALRAVTYSNTSDNPNILSRTIKFIVNDGTSDSNAATRTVDVVPTNDAPVLAAIEIPALAYGVRIGSSPLAITDSIAISEVDSATLASGTVSITANYVASEDVLALVNDPVAMGNITGVFAAGTLSLSSAGASATLTQWRTALRAVTYTNTNVASPNMSPRTVVFKVNDGFLDSNLQTRDIGIFTANDAPSFTKGPDQYVKENDVPPVQTGWATDISVGPPDENAQMVGFIVTNDNAALFSTPPAISNAGDLSYTPRPGAFGTAVVTVALKDDGGTAYGGIDTSAPQTFKIIVNDPPAFTVGPNQTEAEDTGVHTVANWATALLAGTPNQSAQALHFNITGNDNAALFATLPGISPSGDLSYELAPNAFGMATITITLQDDGGGNDTSTPKTFTVTVTPVNDAPTVVVPGAQNTSEDTDLPITGISIADIDAGTADVQVTLSATNGTLRLGDTTGLTTVTGDATAALTASGPLAALNAALATLVYRGNLDYNGSDSLSVVVDDQGNTGGGSLTDTKTVAIVIAPVNDAPAFVQGPDVSAAEDSSAQTRTGWATGISPGPADEAAQTVVAFIVTANTNPGLFAVPPAVSITGELTFTSAPNAFGTATITLVLQDNGGGNDTSTPKTFTITVTPVNDTPTVAVPGAQNTSEETDLPITGIVIADIDAGVSDVQVTLSATNGTLRLGDTTGLTVTGDATAALTASGPLAALNAALATLVYRGNLDYNGSDSLSVAVDDLGNTGGGSLTDTKTIAIGIAPVNDAPTVVVPTAQNASEDTDLPIAGIVIADIDAGTADVQVTLSATKGTLRLGNATGLTTVTGETTAALTASGPLAALNAALATLVYRGNLNYNGSDSLSVAVDDLGKTGAGGSMTATKTIAIVIAPVNDAPTVVVPVAQNTSEETDLPIAGIVIADIDAGASDVKVTLSATKGTLRLVDKTGLTVTGDATAALTASGPLAALNTTLGTLVYRGNLDYNGSDSLSVAVDDLGNTGAGGPLAATKTVAIGIAPVNDAPVLISLPSATPNPAGTGQTITFSAAASDSEDGSVAVSWNFGDGTALVGNSVQHAYATAGVYLVAVKTSDREGRETLATLAVSVGAPLVGAGGNDSDHDGFSDALEAAVGTSPADAGSTPTGRPAELAPQTFFDALAIALNFSRSGRDSISLKGALPLPAGDFSFAGQQIFIDVGGNVLAFTLDSKAKARPKGFVLKLDKKFRQFRFTARVKGGFAAALADEGLVDATVSQAVNVPVTMIFANQVYHKTIVLNYSARAGKRGKTLK